MGLATWQATIVDENGDVVPGASVEVRAETPGQPLVTIYSDLAGASPLSNPTTADSEGFVRFYVANGGYQIRAELGSSPGQFARTWRDVNLISDTDFTDAQADIVAAQDDATQALLTRPGFINGLAISNNVSDATNDIDIAAGSCSDATFNAMQVQSSALTKRLDAAWAAGTNQGGRDTGSISDNWWYVWSIRNSSSGVVDVLFSLSGSSPTMPSGYDRKRLIGAFFRGGGSITAFKQYGTGRARTYIWAVQVNSLDSTNPGTSAVLTAMFVPAKQVEAIIVVFIDNLSTGSTQVLITCPDQTDSVPSSPAPRTLVSDAPGAVTPSQEGVVMRCFTDTSGRIRSRLSVSDANFRIMINTMGWVDYL